MTDVYVAYARQDRDRLRVVGELLRAEGWDSWMDPAEPKPDLSPIADLKLRAILPIHQAPQQYVTILCTPALVLGLSLQLWRAQFRYRR